MILTSFFELLYIRLEYILQELDRQKGSIECLLNLSLREFYQAMNELGYNRAQQVDAIMQIFKACDYEKNNEQYIKRQRDKLLQVYDSEVYENMKDLEIII